DDATYITDPSDLPEVRRHKLPRKGREASPVISGRAATVQAMLQPLRQLRKPRELAQSNPEAEIMAQDARWHKIARYDSAIVSLPDQTSAAFYKRDRDRFVDQMKQTVAVHRRLNAEWDDLAERYREALPEITSPEAWEKTFAPWLDSGQENGAEPTDG
ncbi:MAG: glycosyltransferase family 2 protein, partial [Nocardioides sp.]